MPRASGERDFDTPEVDSKLIRLAKDVSGRIVTNDFNLNKAAQLEGVPVLNINELGRSLHSPTSAQAWHGMGRDLRAEPQQRRGVQKQ